MIVSYMRSATAGSNGPTLILLNSYKNYEKNVSKTNTDDYFIDEVFRR